MQYLDTSALIKLLVLDEVGCETMVSLMLQPGGHATSRLGLVEVASALSRMAREQRLSEAEADELIAASRRASELGLVLIELDEAIQTEAARYLRTYPLRASDAVHLVSALQAGADVFVCSDGRLLTAAEAEGLKCVDPTTPPHDVPES